MQEKMVTAINFTTCFNAIVIVNVYLALHDCLAPIALCKTRNGKTEWFEPGWKLIWPGVHSLIRRGTFFNVDKNWDQIVVKFIPDVIFKQRFSLVVDVSLGRLQKNNWINRYVCHDFNTTYTINEWDI